MHASILVVENHPDLRTETLAILRREHYDCEGVGTGQAALLKLREHDYQYILLDIDAPTDGSAVYDSCAESGTLGKLVLLTAVEELDEMPESASNCALLRKPFDTRELLARIAR